MSHPLAEALSALLGEDAGVGYARVGGTEGLYPEERPAVARAVPQRQAEFAAGRRAARAALKELGHPAIALPVSECRAPNWPAGIMGTITHDRGHALATVLSAEIALGVGIDLTEAAALPGGTRTKILPFASEEELTDLEARAGFSAKESLFKALFPSVRDYFGFDAACVVPDLATSTFRIALTRQLGAFPAGKTWRGNITQVDGIFLTAIRIAR